MYVLTGIVLSEVGRTSSCEKFKILRHAAHHAWRGILRQGQESRKTVTSLPTFVLPTKGCPPVDELP